MFRLCFLCLAVFLNACTTMKTAQQWPAELPPKQFFIKYYQQDLRNQKLMSKETYLLWVRRFYKGWELYRRGWLKTINEVIATLPEEQQGATREQMLVMGQAVAAEWSKSRKYRLINTRHLSIWGNALNQSMIAKEQQEVLDAIQQDITRLLQGDLAPNDLLAGSYYPQEDFVDPFADF